MKPKILYVDDEPNNLIIFEAALSDKYDVIVHSKPMEALNCLKDFAPSVIVSDQRMPGITGVDFLEIASKLCPNSVRIIVTGYSDENLVIESVRKAQILDYLKKPWTADELETSINRAYGFFKANEDARNFQNELQNKTNELERLHQMEKKLRNELESWVPPFVLWAIEQNIEFPFKKELIGITFDIVGSSDVYDKKIDTIPLRKKVIQLFSEAIIKHGGWRESLSGDSVYGHFGLDDSSGKFDSALAVAREFRVNLRNITSVYGLKIECGISLHVSKESVVDIHSVQLSTPKGPVTQKSFDTTSPDIDLLHRMEKMVHDLPGSNIIMSKPFYEGLGMKPNNLIDLGEFILKGQKKATQLFLIPSDQVKDDIITKFKEKFQNVTTLNKVA